MSYKWYAAFKTAKKQPSTHTSEKRNFLPAPPISSSSSLFVSVFGLLSCYCCRCDLVCEQFDDSQSHFRFSGTNFLAFSGYFHIFPACINIMSTSLLRSYTTNRNECLCPVFLLIAINNFAHSMRSSSRMVHMKVTKYVFIYDFWYIPAQRARAPTQTQIRTNGDVVSTQQLYYAHYFFALVKHQTN